MSSRRWAALVAAVVASAVLSGVVVWWVVGSEAPAPRSPAVAEESRDSTASTPAPAPESESVDSDGVRVTRADLWPVPMPLVDNKITGDNHAFARWVDDRKDELRAPSQKGWEQLPASAYDSTGAYAAEFTDAIFTVDFADDDRDDLLAWLSWEVGPFGDSGGLVQPQATWEAFSALQALEPPRSQYALVPNADEWAALADAGATQRVRDVLVMPDKVWEEVRQADDFDERFHADELLDCVAVSATVDRTAGAVTQSKDLWWRMCVGSAVHHPGRGFAAAGEVIEQ